MLLGSTLRIYQTECQALQNPSTGYGARCITLCDCDGYQASARKMPERKRRRSVGQAAAKLSELSCCDATGRPVMRTRFEAFWGEGEKACLRQPGS